MINKLYVILVFALSGFLGCSELSGDSTGANDLSKAGDKTLGGLVYVELGSSKLRLNGTMDNGGNSGHNFELKLLLDADQSGSFYFFATENNLDGGVELHVSRVEDKASLQLSLNGVSQTFTTDLDSEGVLHISFDIHNNEAATHMLMWSIDGPFKDNRTCVREGSCIFNSQYYTKPSPSPRNPGPWGGQGVAVGSYWGYAGDKEMVLELKGPGAVNSHE